MESPTLFALLFLFVFSFASATTTTKDVIKPDCGTCPQPPTGGGGGGVINPPVGGQIPGIVGGVTPVIGGVTPVVGGVVGGVTPVVGGVVPVVGGVVGGVTPTVGGVVGGVTPAVGGVVGGVTPAVGGAGGGVGGVVGGVVPVVGGVVGGVTPTVGGLVPALGGGGVHPPTTGAKPCPTPAPKMPKKKGAKCPLNALKLGACVDLLGGLVHIGAGDPAVNKCCPVISGLAEVEAAVCLCTTLKLKALNLKLYVPIALQLLITCGKTPPPGFTCSL